MVRLSWADGGSPSARSAIRFLRRSPQRCWMRSRRTGIGQSEQPSKSALAPAVLRRRPAPHPRHLALVDHWDVACQILRDGKPWSPNVVVSGGVLEQDWTAFRGRVRCCSRAGRHVSPGRRAADGKGSRTLATSSTRSTRPWLPSSLRYSSAGRARPRQSGGGVLLQDDPSTSQATFQAACATESWRRFLTPPTLGFRRFVGACSSSASAKCLWRLPTEFLTTHTRAGRIERRQLPMHLGNRGGRSQTLSLSGTIQGVGADGSVQARPSEDSRRRDPTHRVGLAWERPPARANEVRILGHCRTQAGDCLRLPTHSRDGIRRAAPRFACRCGRSPRRLEHSPTDHGGPHQARLRRSA